VPGISVGTDMDAFRRKARLFLKPHENHLAVLKVKRNEPLTSCAAMKPMRIITEDKANRRSCSRQSPLRDDARERVDFTLEG